MLEDFKLKVFTEVAAKGSFTLAAKALGVSQPAVSQNIAELEKELGTALLDRSGRSVTLTAAGRTFLEYASRILYWYSVADGMFGPSGKLAAGRPIRIASDIFSGGFILPGVLLKLTASNPCLSFTLSCISGAPEADFTLRCRPHNEELSLEEGASFLGSLPAVAVTSNPAYSEHTSLERLPSGTGYAVWDGYSSSLPSDIEARMLLLTGNIPAILNLVAGSPLVIGIVPAPAARGGMTAIPASLPGLATDIHFEPSGSFSGTPLCAFVRRALSESLGIL